MTDTHHHDCQCQDCADAHAQQAQWINQLIQEAEHRREQRSQQVKYRAPPDPGMIEGGIRQRAMTAVIRVRQERKRQYRQDLVTILTHRARSMGLP